LQAVNRWREQQRKKEREGDRDECDCRKIEYGVDGEHGQQDGYLHDPAIDTHDTPSAILSLAFALAE
jgi:hypothetical protein